MSFGGKIDLINDDVFIGKTIDPLLGIGDAYYHKENGEITIRTEFEFELIIRPADSFIHNWNTNER